jgi:N-methylhydantoinase A/oxoprolinase/acetone carboxylase beta subunit
MRFALAIDIGGTFTDIVLLDTQTGEMVVAKVLTSSDDLSRAVLEGLKDLLIQQGIAPVSVGRAVHGTTLVTNTLIERKGARTALITTEGFRDVLEIGYEGRYDIYDLFLELPRPLVERRLRREVPERLDACGGVLVPLDETALRRMCEELRDEGVEAVAISFLHAYANPAHERRAAEILRGVMPGVTVSVSHLVAPELGEYERTSTTVANAYVQPLAGCYLRRLEEGLRDFRLQAPLHIALSNGGTCSVETASEFPVRLVESGPCGGLLAAAYWCRQAGNEDVLAFDMGGTTAKLSLGTGGRFPLTTKSEVARVYRFKKGSGLPLLVPVMDMIEIGAGGGSIAHVNELGLLTVGPESTGASPGPACYGLGGTEPTITDADLVLGLLNPDYFLGGRMRLRVPEAQAAIGRLARSLNLSVEQTAWRIHHVVNENMANAARVHAAERGLDTRRYTMVATGGAGPVHACGVAQRLGVRTVVVPPAAGMASAFGLLLSPISFDFVRSYVGRPESLDLSRLNALLDEMEWEGWGIVSAAGVPEDEIAVVRTADMRYVRQEHEIRVPVASKRLDDGALQALQEEFNQEYRRVYGRLCEGVPVEAVHWRVTVSGPPPEVGQVRVLRDEMTGVGDAFKGRRPIVFDLDVGSVEVPVYDRQMLHEKFEANGPVIVEEVESTAVVPPNWSVRVDTISNVVLTRS